MTCSQRRLSRLGGKVSAVSWAVERRELQRTPHHRRAPIAGTVAVRRASMSRRIPSTVASTMIRPLSTVASVASPQTPDRRDRGVQDVELPRTVARKAADDVHDHVAGGLDHQVGRARVFEKRRIEVVRERSVRGYRHGEAVLWGMAGALCAPGRVDAPEGKLKTGSDYRPRGGCLEESLDQQGLVCLGASARLASCRILRVISESL